MPYTTHTYLMITPLNFHRSAQPTDSSRIQKLHPRYKNISKPKSPQVGIDRLVLALPPHSNKVMDSIPAWGAVGSGGQILPRPSVLRWAISRAFLCGVCMFSPCSQGVSSTNNPNRKTCKKNRTLSSPSLTKTDGSLHLVPRRLKTAPGVLEEGQSGMGKSRD